MVRKTLKTIHTKTHIFELEGYSHRLESVDFYFLRGLVEISVRGIPLQVEQPQDNTNPTPHSKKKEIKKINRSQSNADSNNFAPKSFKEEDVFPRADVRGSGYLTCQSNVISLLDKTVWGKDQTSWVGARVTGTFMQAIVDRVRPGLQALTDVHEQLVLKHNLEAFLKEPGEHLVHYLSLGTYTHHATLSSPTRCQYQCLLHGVTL